MAGNSEYSRLVKRLKGQQVLLPSLQSLFVDWPGVVYENINPHLEDLARAVDERLRRICTQETTLRKLQLADFATFTALWWPSAELEQLKTLAYLVIWLFTWDDELDEPSGSCADDFDAAQRYRAETTRFVQHCLGFHDATNDLDPKPTHPIIESFRPIGEAFARIYDFEQRQRLCEEILRLIDGSQREQEWRLSGKVPTLEEFWQTRLGTSAVYVGVASQEYCNLTCLPSTIINSPSMQAIWNETNVLISITNDLLSLKKEMQQDCIYSIVPLTCAGGKSVQESIAEAVLALRDSRDRFNQAADSLMEQDFTDETTRAQVARFIEGCRSNVVGNLMWSLKTHRYGMGSVALKDGYQEFIL